MNSKIFWGVILCFLALVTGCQIYPPLSADAPLQFDQNIAKGVLPNGLRYYVQANDEPSSQVHFYFIVNAGSMNETDEQKGLAHYVEHMAFNGTEQYPQNQLIRELEKIGMKFGRDINAFTDFENTVYRLSLPQNNPEHIQLALNIIREWLCCVTILPQDVDDERGIILEEWRARLGPMLRLGDKKSAIEMAGSRYITRDPIGDINLIKRVKSPPIKAFYKTWYRPDNVAVVVVGDIQTQPLVQQIRQTFEHIKKPNAPLEKIDYQIPLQPHWRVAHITEKGIDTPSIELSFMQQAKSQSTFDSIRQDFYQQVMIRLINQRLQYWEKQHSHFVESANFYITYLGKETQQMVFSLQLKQADYPMALQHLFNFIAQIEQQGFLKQEWQQEALRLTSLNHQQLKRKETSATLAENLMLAVAAGQTLQSKQHVFTQTLSLLKQSSEKEIQQTFQKMTALPNRLVIFTTPTPQAKPIINETALQQRWQQTLQTPQERWYQEESVVSLPNIKVRGGTIRQKRSLSQGKIQHYYLSNGSDVFFFYTNQRPKQVYFKALTEGGLRSVPNEQYHALRTAVRLVDENGIGSLTQQEWDTLRNQKSLMFSTLMEDTQQGFSGNAQRQDLETLLKLFHLRFSSASIRASQLTEYQQDVQKNHTQDDAQYRFAQQISALRYPHLATVYSETPEDINALSLDWLQQLYSQRVLAKTDFTYFIVGDISTQQLEPLIARYLASVPYQSYHTQINSPKVNLSIPKTFIGNGLAEPRAEVEVYLTVPQKWQAKTALVLDILGEVIQHKLSQVLREQASGVYSVRTWFNQDINNLQQEGKIEFSCAPRNVKQLTQLTQQVLKELQQNGIDHELLHMAIQQKQQQLDLLFQQPLFILDRLEQSYQLTQSVENLYQEQTLLHSLTTEEIIRISQDFLANSQWFEAVLLP